MVDLNRMIKQKRSGEKDYEVTSDAKSKFYLKVAEGAFKKFCAYRDFYIMLSGDTELYAFQACRPGEDFTRDIILGHRQESNTSTRTSLAQASDNFVGGSRLTSLEVDRKGMTIRGWAHVHPFSHYGKPGPSGTDRANNITLLYSRQGSPTCRVRLYEYVNLATETSIEGNRLVLHNNHTGQDVVFEIPEGVDPSQLVIPKVMIRSPVEDTVIWSMIINGRSSDIKDAYVEYLTQRISRLGETKPEGPFSIPSAQLIKVEDDVVFDDKSILVEIFEKIKFKQPLIKVCDKIRDAHLQEAVREEIKGWESYPVPKRRGYWIITKDWKGEEIDAKHVGKPKIKKMRDFYVKRLPEAVLARLDKLAEAKLPYLELLKLGKKDLAALQALSPKEIELLKQKTLEEAVEAPTLAEEAEEDAATRAIIASAAQKDVSFGQKVADFLQYDVGALAGRLLRSMREKTKGRQFDDEVKTPYGKGRLFAEKPAPEETAPEKQAEKPVEKKPEVDTVTLKKAKKIAQSPDNGGSYDEGTLREGEKAVDVADKATEKGVDTLAQKAFDRARELREKGEEKKD